MNPHLQQTRAITRRHFFRKCQTGVGAMALASLMGRDQARGAIGNIEIENPLAAKRPMFAPKAKRVIYLHMAGSPPQHDLFDWKPELVKHNMQPCPDSFMKNERFAFIKGVPKLLGTPHKFAQHGQAGTWMSDVWKHLPDVADDIAVVRSMHTTQFNHAPAQLYLHTGEPRFGFASMGSWMTYGLGTENQDLPGYVVLVSGGTDPSGGKSLWGSGFLPSVYQGVQCRSFGDPILYVSNPKGMSREVRARSLAALKRLNEYELREVGDPETLARISQYELAYRMQIAVPEVMDISREPKSVHEDYGTQPGKENFANNCLLARRMAEQGVRFVQLFHYGWDFHGNQKGSDIKISLPGRVAEIDRPITALLKDLKQRGMLDETLVVWSGEFGRTPMNEERNGSKFLGRDHHPHAFTLWMAGGGIKGGVNYGETDELGYHVVRDKMSVHDLQLTLLHLMGIDGFKFTHNYQGLDQRIIGPAGEAQLHPAILS